MFIRYKDFDSRFRSLYALPPEATMQIDFEKGITTLDIQFFVGGKFIDGKEFKKVKYGKMTAWITDHDFFNGRGGSCYGYSILGDALDSINIPYTDYEDSEDKCARTVTVNGWDHSIAFLTEMEVDPTYQDQKISNLQFSAALRYLKRLDTNYVIIKPYPTDVPKGRFLGKKASIQYSITELIIFYEKYGFELTIGIHDIGQPYMICCLDEIDIRSTQLRINYELNDTYNRPYKAT